MGTGRRDWENPTAPFALVVAGEMKGAGVGTMPPPKFWAVEKLSSCRIILIILSDSLKMQNLGLNPLFLGQF